MITLVKVGAFDNDLLRQINANFSELSAAAVGGALDSGKIIVGSAGNAATPRTASGDATISNTGVVAVVGVNGSALETTGAAIAAAVAIIAAIPVVNQASPAIWNDGGVLKVGTA